MEHVEARLLDHEHRLSALEKGHAVNDANYGNLAATMARVEKMLSEQTVPRSEHDVICGIQEREREDLAKEVLAVTNSLAAHVEGHTQEMRKWLFWGVTALASAVFAATFIAKGVLK